IHEAAISWPTRVRSSRAKPLIRRFAPPSPRLRGEKVERQRMSRLDSFIRRMEAQRDCLNWAAAQVRDAPGPILEVGLGNGRTYDHLRLLLPGRDIYIFEREVRAHPDCIPPADRLFLGDVHESIPRAARALGRSAILIHSDLGTGDHAAN